MLRTVTLVLAVCAATSAAAASNVIPLKLASGEILVHAFNGGMPLPSESKWVRCTYAGPSFIYEGGKVHRGHWRVHLNPKSSLVKVHDIAEVTIQEVSGTKVVPMFHGPPQLGEPDLIIKTPEIIVSPEQYPWLYQTEPTLFVLRITLHATNGQKDLLLQPVVIGTEAKRTLRTMGRNG